MLHVRLPMDGGDGRLLQYVTFFCCHCQRPLEGCGYINKLVCLKCRCIFQVKVELIELKGPDVDADLRQLPGAGETTGGSGQSVQESLPSGSGACGEVDTPEGHPV
jgi:hypothetical protein